MTLVYRQILPGNRRDHALPPVDCPHDIGPAIPSSRADGMRSTLLLWPGTGELDAEEFWTLTNLPMNMPHERHKTPADPATDGGIRLCFAGWLVVSFAACPPLSRHERGTCLRARGVGRERLHQDAR